MSIMTTASRPDTRHTHGGYEWMSLSDVLALPAMDFADRGPGHDTLADPANQADKREDRGYAELVDSIRKDGWLTPVCLCHFIPGTGPAIVNGHHRVVVAVDLGYSEIPIKMLESDEDLLDYWGDE